MSFASLRLADPLVRAIATKGYTAATEIQAGAIPPALEGRDVLGTARTGTGKTCAFALPILHLLSQQSRKLRPRKKKNYQRHHREIAPRALVLCPTRELANQIHVSFKEYGSHVSLKYAVVFGGVKQYHQVRSMRNGVDVLIATPGRLKDLIQQNIIDLSAVEILVLDEADRMLDMGFIADIRHIEAMIKKKRQTLLFSATISKSIRILANDLMRDPVVVETAPESTPVESIKQRVIMVEQPQKVQLLTHVLRKESVHRALVFARTKHSADKLSRRLKQYGFASDALHSNKSQSARNSIMQEFRSGSVQVLVATDIASRGIDVQSITHVVNFDMPIDPETYVHRIGRTARAGESGQAITFCCRSQRKMLRSIEKRSRMRLPASENLPSMDPLPQTRSESSGKSENSTAKQRDTRKTGRSFRPISKSSDGGTSSAKKKYAKKPYRSTKRSENFDRNGDHDVYGSGDTRYAKKKHRRSRGKTNSQPNATHMPSWREGGEASTDNCKGTKKSRHGSSRTSKKPNTSKKTKSSAARASSQDGSKSKRYKRGVKKKFSKQYQR
ncbi:MAG: DEAD/DEAH box helicase [Phycisphaerales bacterium]|nr:DEAD/DEAH box helicase [Phycisphaerales bacterium]